MLRVIAATFLGCRRSPLTELAPPRPCPPAAPRQTDVGTQYSHTSARLRVAGGAKREAQLYSSSEEWCGRSHPGCPQVTAARLRLPVPGAWSCVDDKSSTGSAKEGTKAKLAVPFALCEHEGVRIVIAREAGRVLARMQPAKAKDIREAIDKVAADPTAPNNNLRPLKGVPNGFRIRVGDWRVSYTL